MKTFNVLLLMTLPFFLFSQEKVVFETLGISFTIPNGWYGEEVASGYLLTAQNGNGYILLKTHQAKTIEELKMGAKEGITDESSSSQLNLAGQIEQLNSTSIGAEFTGIVEWTPAKAYIVGRLNPFGNGITVIATTAKNNYSKQFEQLAKQVAASFEFEKPKASEEVKKWAQKLKDCRLTAMDSFSSTSGAYGEHGSYHSSKKVLDLCAKGYFSYSGTSSSSFDYSGGFGHANSSGNGDGTWKVIGNAEGQAVLQLTFNDGEIYELLIKYKDYKTYLNGERYFRTYDEKKGPNCN